MPKPPATPIELGMTFVGSTRVFKYLVDRQLFELAILMLGSSPLSLGVGLPPSP
jgi:hypothetical protein